MSLKKFMGLYQSYKDMYDLDLIMKSRKITFKDLDSNSRSIENENVIEF